MEPLFEYFYEIQGFSLLAAFGVSILGGYVKYNLRGSIYIFNKVKIRKESFKSR